LRPHSLKTRPSMLAHRLALAVRAASGELG
jgi:hypothetical protein